MPALTKDKLIKRVQPTPVRTHPKSLANTDVKRLGSNRRTSSKRIQTQSIQTQTALASLIQNEKQKRVDAGTQTNDDVSHGLTSRVIRFFGGTINSFVKYFDNSK